jgi:hypothetical protein
MILRMIKKYPAALQHHDENDNLPIHIEGRNQCRSSVVSKFVEIYPESLSMAAGFGYQPLHLILEDTSSSVELALMMIEKYPAALRHESTHGYLPIHIECSDRCRPSIVSKCVELYPEAFDDRSVIIMIMRNVNRNNFSSFVSTLSTVFATRPMSLYQRDYMNLDEDIRDIVNPRYRRRILQLLPRHVFTPRHDADYRDLNWQPRTAMMMLLSQVKIKIQQQSKYKH